MMQGEFFAVAASAIWALAAVLAHKPALALGAFEFTRVQLIGVSGCFLILVTATTGWSSMSWDYFPQLTVAGVIGVVMANLLMAECLREAGPRLTQLMLMSVAPLTVILASWTLGEQITAKQALGGAIILVALAAAISTRGRNGPLREGSNFRVFGLGLSASLCQAIGLVAMKPALDAGLEPLVGSALRTTGGAIVIAAASFFVNGKPLHHRHDIRLVATALLPGFLGYGLAVTLLLYGLHQSATGMTALLGGLAPLLVLPIMAIIDRRAPPAAAWLATAMALLGLAVVIV